ncbi:MAG: ABC transporter ATP-binding protein [Chitinophagales bacterium]
MLTLTLLLASINQGFSMMDPLIMGKMVNYVTITKNALASDFYRAIVLFLLALIGVAMVSRIAKNFQDYFLNVIIQKTGVDVYTDGIGHSLDLPYEVFEDQRSGETLGKLQKVRDDMQRLLTALVNILFTSIVGIIWVTVYSITVYWVIAPIYFTAIPIIFLVSSTLSRKIKKMQKVIVTETTGLAGATTESLRNIELVKSLGLAKQEIDQLNNTTVKILGLELKKVRYIRSLSFIQGTCVNFLRVSLMGVMMYLIFIHKINVGEFLTLLFYSFFIFGPLQEMGNIINTYREAEVSLGNFKQIMETPVEKRPAQPRSIGDMFQVEFDQVSFKHRTSKTFAVKEISFKVQAGETVALVGPSGSGKTTLVKLLVGLYQPQSGRITYNGLDSRDVDLNELREQIGFVTQDPQLFSGTIRENMLFVNPDATDDEILDALHKAACENLLSRAEKGLDSMIGEGGVKVSGGEKQRLSIARALLRKPNLVVFDEATSALDSLTEEEISETIRSVSTNTNRTTIMIAHRLSTIMHADRIYVLERGKIIEEGQHNDLLLDKGLYYAMWRQQIGERKELEPAFE